MEDDRTSRGQQRREHFRVAYPLVERPKLMIWKREHDVIDISEQGVKFSCDKSIMVRGTNINRATIRFHDGEIVEIEGKVVRTGVKEAILRLSKEIPYKRIVEEQRYIKSKYGKYS